MSRRRNETERAIISLPVGLKDCCGIAVLIVVGFHCGIPGLSGSGPQARIVASGCTVILTSNAAVLCSDGGFHRREC